MKTRQNIFHQPTIVLTCEASNGKHTNKQKKLNNQPKNILENQINQ